MSTTTDEVAELVSLLRDIGLAGYPETAEDPGIYSDAYVRGELQSSLNVRQLQQLPEHAEHVLRNGCVLLPPINKDGVKWIPFLWVTLAQADHVSLQLVMAAPDMAFGFRWESPEDAGLDSSSEHGYWHAQPIKTVRTGSGAVRPIPKQDRISDHFPTFPIDAIDSVTLLGAVVISLYGQLHCQSVVRNVAFLRRVCIGTHRAIDANVNKKGKARNVRAKGRARKK